eukprot:scaffold28319_cov65-Cyclotella_meneghiniana.AAC.5
MDHQLGEDEEDEDDGNADNILEEDEDNQVTDDIFNQKSYQSMIDTKKEELIQDIKDELHDERNTYITSVLNKKYITSFLESDEMNKLTSSRIVMILIKISSCTKCFSIDDSQHFWGDW